MIETIKIIMATAKGGPYICQAPEATPSKVIPVTIMISVHQYPSFVDVTVLLRVPLNLSAIPINPNGSTNMLNEAVPQSMGLKGDS